MSAHFSVHMATALALSSIVIVVLTRSRHWTPYRAFTNLWKSDLIFGIWTMLPFLLSQVGMPMKLLEHPVMNIFAGYQWIRNGVDGGLLIGSALLILQIAGRYLLLLSCIVRTGR